MKTYNARCPVCGAENHSLYLEETGGWMECSECGTVSQVYLFAPNSKLPCLAQKPLSVAVKGAGKIPVGQRCY